MGQLSYEFISDEFIYIDLCPLSIDEKQKPMKSYPNQKLW